MVGRLGPKGPATGEMGEDDYLAHEALHTTHVCVCMLNDHVTSHVYVAQDTELTRLAEAAEDAIAALYQAIANKRTRLIP